MPSHEPPRDRSSDLELTTLAIAAAASAAAAFVTSQVWPAGTLWSAAATPVIVALVKEALARPAQRIQTVRTTRARQAPVVGPEPPTVPQPADEAGLSGVRVYGAGRRRRRWRLAIVTGLLAFAGVAALYTVPELVAGKSLGRGGDNRTTLFGGEPRGTKTETRDDRGNDARATPAPEATAAPDEAVEPTPTPEATATPEATPTPSPTAAATPTPTP